MIPASRSSFEAVFFVPVIIQTALRAFCFLPSYVYWRGFSWWSLCSRVLMVFFLRLESSSNARVCFREMCAAGLNDPLLLFHLVHCTWLHLENCLFSPQNFCLLCLWLYLQRVPCLWNLFFNLGLGNVTTILAMLHFYLVSHYMRACRSSNAVIIANPSDGPCCRFPSLNEHVSCLFKIERSCWRLCMHCALTAPRKVCSSIEDYACMVSWFYQECPNARAEDYACIAVLILRVNSC